MKTKLRDIYDVHGDKFRFLIVGMVNTAVGYALFLAMLWVVQSAIAALTASGVAVPPVVAKNYFLIAQWTSWALSVPVGMFNLKHFVFHSKGHWLPELGRAYLVYLPGTLVNSGILWVGVHMLDLKPAFAQLIAIAVVVVFSYLGHKYFTFREPAVSDTPGESD